MTAAETTRPATCFSGPELCALPAREVERLLTSGQISPEECITAAETRIHQVEPAVNAVVTPCPDRARAMARDLPRTTRLGGLPIGIKDLTPVAGVRTTMGTPAMADHVPDTSDPLVLRLEDRGALVMGKTNTPEMGAGGNTFNAVFGATRNPWDTALNCGGSSGGAAVSVATGEVWLSHGSDLAGSLRTPASFCSVVGLRPSPGVAGGGPATLAWNGMGVQGPMARDVADCALFLDAMAGFDPQWPLSWPAPETPYLQQVTEAKGPLRIAFAPDLGGFAPVEPDIRATHRAAMDRLARDGHHIEETCPALPDLERTYRTLRAAFWAMLPGRAPQAVQDGFKPTLADNVDEGRAPRMSVDQLYDAEIARAAIYDTLRHLYERFDVLAFPVTGIAPGPVEVEYPPEVAGQPVIDYVDWLRFSFLPVVAGLPALSLPCGFTPDGRPVGLQLMGRPRGDGPLLAAAALIETSLALPTGPIDPRPA